MKIGGDAETPSGVEVIAKMSVTDQPLAQKNESKSPMLSLAATITHFWAKSWPCMPVKV